MILTKEKLIDYHGRLLEHKIITQKIDKRKKLSLSLSFYTIKISGDANCHEGKFFTDRIPINKQEE